MAKIFSRYDVPPSPAIEFKPGSSLTRQEFAQESDINRLVAHYQETGSFYDPVTEAKAAARKPLFGDFINVPDYQTAMDKVVEAEGLFAQLPAKVRDRFQNDPKLLLDFIQDKANFDEAVSLGLLPKPEEPPPPPVEMLAEKPPEAAE